MVIKCKSSPTRPSQQPLRETQLKLCFRRHRRSSQSISTPNTTSPKRLRFIKADRQFLAFRASHFSLCIFQFSGAPMASISASNFVALKSAVKFGATTDGRACQFKQWAPIGGATVWGRSIGLQYGSKRSSTSPGNSNFN